MRPATRIPALLAATFLVASCEEVEQVQDRFRDHTPHEAYLASLSASGLAGTALVRDWIRTSREAVAAAPLVALPFQEEGFIPSDEAAASAYRIRIERGQRLRGEISVESPEETRVFMDLFRVPDEETDPLRPVFAADSVPGTFEYEPWRGGEFILRVQPELLRGGRYRVTLRLEAQLAFPVEGRDERAIGSVWGQPRDGGRRSHEGVDIFAPRGTPVLATSAGVVNRVRVTNLGGKVVWVRDEARGANLYFAHLDSQAVSSGQRVAVGDTLGFVGNTGNARGTSPHLHFGIYRRGEGAVDPSPFLRRPRGTLAALDVDLERLGGWVRMRDGGVLLRDAPSLGASTDRELDRHTPLEVLGGSGDWYRVRLPDGARGYVQGRLTESLEAPLSTLTADRGDPVHAHPDPSAPVMAALVEGTAVPVLGRFGAYLMVQTPEGRTGWMGAGET